MRCADFTIVVVDNRPSDPQTKALVASFAARTTKPVRYVAEPRVGASAARNAGIAAVPEAMFLAFTDDDVEVDPEWLSRLLGPFIEPQVRAVTGLVLPMTLDSAVQKRFERYAGFGKGVHGETYDMGAHRARDRFLFPYWGGVFGSGNSMAFRRNALLAVGGFDCALGPGTPTGGAEDIAALSDVILGGGTIVYEPRSVCWHAHRDDEDGLREQVHRYGIGLTAVLWRYFRRDWRFTVAVVRSLPLVLKLMRSRSADRQADRLPTDLLRLESRGRLLGPWRYEISRRHQTDHP
jgi:glycosyltransferase involved in cell wall biosynthesis